MVTDTVSQEGICIIGTVLNTGKTPFFQEGDHITAGNRQHGANHIAVDWRKAVRKWFCKENGLVYSEMETMSDICHDVLSKVKVVPDET